MNVALLLVREGLAEVRKVNPTIADKDVVVKQLIKAEEEAKALRIGKWSESLTEGTREVVWTISDPKVFLDANKGVPLKGIIEYVRDGSTYHVTILPNNPSDDTRTFYNIVLSLSGVKSPTIRYDGGQQVRLIFI